MNLGVFNNNPFNIRYSPLNHWQGQIGSNKGFCVFSTMTKGLRAGIKLLLRYITVLKVDTPKSIIERFAPDTENDTYSYYTYVSKHIGISYNVHIVTLDEFFLLCQAICKYETNSSLSREQFDFIISYYRIQIPDSWVKREAGSL